MIFMTELSIAFSFYQLKPYNYSMFIFELESAHSVKPQNDKSL